MISDRSFHLLSLCTVGPWCLLVNISLLTFPHRRPNGKLTDIQCYLLMGKSCITGWLWIWCHSNWTPSCGLDYMMKRKYFWWESSCKAKMQYVSYLKNSKPALTVKNWSFWRFPNTLRTYWNSPEMIPYGIKMAHTQIPRSRIFWE